MWNILLPLPPLEITNWWCLIVRVNSLDNLTLCENLWFFFLILFLHVSSFVGSGSVQYFWGVSELAAVTYVWLCWILSWKCLWYCKYPSTGESVIIIKMIEIDLLCFSNQSFNQNAKCTKYSFIFDFNEKRNQCGHDYICVYVYGCVCSKILWLL